MVEPTHSHSLGRAVVLCAHAQNLSLQSHELSLLYLAILIDNAASSRFNDVEAVSWIAMAEDGTPSLQLFALEGSA